MVNELFNGTADRIDNECSGRIINSCFLSLSLVAEPSPKMDISDGQGQNYTQYMPEESYDYGYARSRTRTLDPGRADGAGIVGSCLE